jgi:hypothetical protein
VKAVDGLVAVQSQFIQEEVHRFVYLLMTGLFAFLPTDDVVIDGVFASNRLLGQG